MDSIKELLLLTKERAVTLIDLLEKIKKKSKCKNSKVSKEVFKILKDFVKCNITSPSIMIKYERVINILNKYGYKKDSGNGNKS